MAIIARLTYGGNLQVNTPVTGTIFNELDKSAISIDPNNFYAVEFDEVAFTPLGQPQYITDSKTQNISTGTSITISVPAATQPGDLLFVVLKSNQSADSFNAVSGWTLNNYAAANAFLYKQFNVGDPTSFTFTGTVSAALLQGYMTVWRNVYVDVIGTSTTVLSTSITASSINVSTDNSFVIALFGAGQVSGITFTTPTGFTLLDSDSDATAPSSALFYKVANTGATGGVTSNASSSVNLRALLLSLAPTNPYPVPMRYLPAGNVRIAGIFDETSTLT